MRIRLIVLTLFAAAAFSSLIACGQKGPLRLPNPGNYADEPEVAGANKTWSKVPRQ